MTLRRTVAAARLRLHLAAPHGEKDRERGSAIIEFSFLAVLLLVPLTYVILTVFRLQAGAYAVSSAAREAGRIFVTSDEGVAYDRSLAAARVAMEDHGFPLSAGNVDLRCSDPGDCHAPRSTVHVTVERRIRLPLIPEFFDGVVPTSVRVSADHVEYVDRFRPPDEARTGGGQLGRATCTPYGAR